MIDFKARIEALGLPLDRTVVIASGLLDRLGLRAANDLDLAVSPGVFRTLFGDERFEHQQKNGSERFIKGDELEIWPGWDELSFQDLFAESVDFDGVHFVSPKQLVQKKRERGSVKDLADIQLLEEYYDKKF